MHKYDVALKSLLQTSGLFLERLAGVRLKWTGTGELIHFELQSTNDPKMPLRMAEYALVVYKQFERFPRQFVLYVGELAIRMSPPVSLFSWRLVPLLQLSG